VSIDSPHTHLAWLRTPKDKGGIQGVEYPIVSDLTKRISRSFGVLKEDMGVAYRGLFIIDPDGVVQHQLINNLPIGRSVDEALRVLDAIQFHAEHGEVCPANWKKGEAGMEATTQGVSEYLAKT
jgi:peroxiredoxin (alkyl hydroperoxide reductase subunit C)